MNIRYPIYEGVYRILTVYRFRRAEGLSEGSGFPGEIRAEEPVFLFCGIWNGRCGYTVTRRQGKKPDKMESLCDGLPSPAAYV